MTDPNSDPDSAPQQPEARGMSPHEYWRRNLRCVLVLLAAWFAVSFGCGVLFVDALDNFRIPGTGLKVGFWFAQQGSIFAFLAIIWIYVWYMNRLDRKYRSTK